MTLYFTNQAVLLADLNIDNRTDEASWTEFGGYPRTLYGVQVATGDGTLTIRDGDGLVFSLIRLTDIDVYNAFAERVGRDQYDTIADAEQAYQASLADQCKIDPSREDRFVWNSKTVKQMTVHRAADQPSKGKARRRR
jgi:hypothetical protein